MAGPYGTAILDNFTRADAPTLGASWTADPVGFGFTSFSIVSNQASGVGFDANWWNTQYAADQEAYFTIGTTPDSNVRIYARLVAPGTTAGCDGYALVIDPTSFVVYTMVDAVPTTVIASVAYTPVTGHRVALACVGTSIEGWRDTGSGWALFASGTNALYSGAGYVGIHSQNNTTLTIDDFGGGTVGGGPAADTQTRRYQIRRSRMTSW